MDPDDVSSDAGDNSDDDERARPREEDRYADEDKEEEKVLSPKVIKRLKEMAAKLDAILKVVFDFLERIKGSSLLFSRPGLIKSASQRTLPGSPIPFNLDSPRGGPNENNAADYLATHNHAVLQNVIYRVLLSAFEEKILRTFQTRHTQFILFWYASLSPEFADEFTGTLLGRVVNDEDTPTVTRVAAAAYVASFISRSSSIDGNVARQVMSLLCQCLDAELEQVRFASSKGPLSGPEADRLIKSSVVFYAVSQAAFYIFCFRWRDFLDESEEEIDFLEGVPAKRRWMLELDSLKMAVNSPLNPLKVSFLHQTKA
jgi:RNA polymerase I-specific transcription initiation factor RRN3